MNRENFFKEFRQEHREIRDLLFDMITSFAEEDFETAGALLKRLNSMIETGSTEKDDITECINTIRSILPHISDCEGLSIMVERMDDGIVNTICDSMKKARKTNLPLIEWSETSRNRKPLHIKSNN